MAQEFSRSQQVDILQQVLRESNKGYKSLVEEGESETATEDLEKELNNL